MNVITELEDAIVVISTLSVSGEAVDVIATTKFKIRKAIAELTKEAAKKDGEKNG